AMLRRAPAWHRIARDTALGLLDLAPLPDTLFSQGVPTTPGAAARDRHPVSGPARPRP
ncbi:hypothetical protein GTW69_07355, partial [Streptomyces sp. SID7760]|nr:hypothetical protein [Streptomyces sp. SID7760]